MLKIELRSEGEHFGAVNLVLYLPVGMSNKWGARTEEVRNRSFEVRKGIETRNKEYCLNFQLIVITPLQRHLPKYGP